MFEADLDVFFQLGELAIAVQVEPADGDPFEITAIYASPAELARLGLCDLDVQRHRLTCKFDDVKDCQPRDVFVVKGESLWLVNRPLNEDGICELELGTT
jgi:hypothetical protein